MFRMKWFTWGSGSGHWFTKQNNIYQRSVQSRKGKQVTGGINWSIRAASSMALPLLLSSKKPIGISLKKYWIVCLWGSLGIFFENRIDKSDKNDLIFN